MDRTPQTTGRHPNTVLSGQARLAWLEFADMHKARRHSPRTIETYGDALAQLQLWLDEHRAGTSVLEVTRNTLTSFLASLAETRSGSTVANRYRALVQFYKWCAEEDMFSVSPMARVECPKFQAHIVRVLSDDELMRLLATTRPAGTRSFEDYRDEALLRVWCEPGSPRASEMSALDLADFDMEAKTVSIRNGKGQLSRVIQMSASTSRAVFAYLRRRAAHRLADSPAMFIGQKGRLTRFGLGQMCQRRGEAAGIGKVGPHQLRHTSFADFDANGGSVNHAMALFGWRSPAMAHYYGRDARARTALAASAQMARADRLAAR